MLQSKKQTKIIFKNILGEEENDPVCDYLSCYHKFSIHSHRSHQNEFNCIYKHPQNHVIGVVKLTN